MTRAVTVVMGLVVLFAAWVWPFRELGLPPFTEHMTMHMAVIAVASPLVAVGLAGGRFDLAARAPRLSSPIAASMLELVAVWSWHAPVLHRWARQSTAGLLLEQATFLITGLALWVAALGGPSCERRERAPLGILGLLLTAMHMTLLGVIIGLTPRLLYEHTDQHGLELDGSTGHGVIEGVADAGAWLTPLADQHLGGAVMIVMGLVAYLSGALALAARVLTPEARGERDPARKRARRGLS